MIKRLLSFSIALLFALCTFAGSDYRLNYFYDVSKYVKDYARVTYNFSQESVSFQVRDDNGIFFFPLGEKERADFVYMFHEGGTTDQEKTAFLNRLIKTLMQTPPELSSYHPFEGDAYTYTGTQNNNTVEEIDPLENLSVTVERLNKDISICMMGQWNDYSQYGKLYEHVRFKPDGTKTDFVVYIPGGSIEFTLGKQDSDIFLSSLNNIESLQQRSEYVESTASYIINTPQSHNIYITYIPDGSNERFDYRQVLSAQQDSYPSNEDYTSGGLVGSDDYTSSLKEDGAIPDNTEKNNSNENTNAVKKGAGGGGGILVLLLILYLIFRKKGKSANNEKRESFAHSESTQHSIQKREEAERKKKKEAEEKRKQEEEEERRRKERRREREEQERRKRKEQDDYRRGLYQHLYGDKP